jgi:hypothetical protein
MSELSAVEMKDKEPAIAVIILRVWSGEFVKINVFSRFPTLCCYEPAYLYLDSLLQR